MKKLLVAVVMGSALGGTAWSDGLPKASAQMLIKSLQDTNLEVRVAAAQALGQFEESAAVQALEAALIASTDAKEQEALVQALLLNKESDTVKRLTDALNNPQFTWGAGAKPRAVEVVGKLGGKKSLKWLTSLLGSEQEPAMRAAAARVMGEIGAPPKKEKS